MTFDSELRAELKRAGIDKRRARRIELELADHRACAPTASLGTPREIADRFALELRLPLTRRAGKIGFAALALTAAMLCSTVLAFALTNVWAHTDLVQSRGAAVAAAGIAAMIAAQLSFVAGVLSLVPLIGGRALRLAQRRLAIALWASLVVVAAEVVQVVALEPYLARWLVTLMFLSAVLPGIVLAGALSSLHRAARVTLDTTTVSAFPPALLAGVAVLAVVAVTVAGTVAERSWQEGLTRGVIEATGIAVCFVAFARRLALRD